MANPSLVAEPSAGPFIADQLAMVVADPSLVAGPFVADQLALEVGECQLAVEEYHLLEVEEFQMAVEGFQMAVEEPQILEMGHLEAGAHLKVEVGHRIVV